MSWRTAACPVCLMLATLAAGCSEMSETSILFKSRPPGACTATIESVQRPMNSFMVEVYSIEAIEPLPNDCHQCVMSTSGCTLLERRCTCGDDRPTDPEQAAAALSGTRLEVDLTESYCVRVVAYELTGPPKDECSCPLQELPFPEPSPISQLRLCAINMQPAAAEQSIELEAFCLDEISTGPPICVEDIAPPEPPVDPPG